MIMNCSSYFYYLLIIIISNSLSVYCQKQGQRTYRELITEPVKFLPNYHQVFNHNELPVVKDELSVTLKINIISHDNSNNSSIFYKGRTDATNRTPSLWLLLPYSTPHVDCSITGDSHVGFDLDGYGFQINQWYHIVYTLSDPEKRMNLYIDGKWVGSYSLTTIQRQSVIFNDKPLYIGKAPPHLPQRGIHGLISNFRYYNFRLSSKEVLMDYSGEDPTKSHDDEDGECSCPETSKIFIGPIIGSFFLGMIILVGCYFIRRSINRNQYQVIT